MSSLFVAETTSDHKRRYKLPGGGTLQRTAGAGRYGAVKAFGSWDIGLPLEDFGAQIAGSVHYHVESAQLLYRLRHRLLDSQRNRDR